MASEMADLNPAVRRELNKAMDGLSGMFRMGFAAMKKRGELHSGTDPAALADFTLAAIQGGMLLAKTSRDPSRMKQVFKQTLTHLQSHSRG